MTLLDALLVGAFRTLQEGPWFSHWWGWLQNDPDSWPNCCAFQLHLWLFPAYSLPSPARWIQALEPAQCGRTCGPRRVLAKPGNWNLSVLDVAVSQRHLFYLRAAAPAADPGKESGIAGETGKLCDEKLWQMHYHKQETSSQTPFVKHNRNSKTPPNFVPNITQNQSQ